MKPHRDWARLFVLLATICTPSGDRHNRFHFEYKLGKSIGTLTIVKPVSIQC